MDIINATRIAEKRLKFDFPYSVDEWVDKLDMRIENYHKHTTWSDLVQIDSATDIVDFMRMSNARGTQCLFSGEHGYQGEWLYIYDLCKNSKNEDFRQKNGLTDKLKFRYSTEAYWVKDRNEVKTVEVTSKKGEKTTKEIQDNTNCHIVIVARTYNAMRKLNYILSEAHVNGFYYKPRIDLDLLFTLSPDDVYITSACVAGWKYEDATEVWIKVWEHFKDSFFLEYQANDTPEQKELNARIYEISKTLGIQTIIGMDTHYINEEDRIKRDNLLTRKGLDYPEEYGWFMDFPSGSILFDRMKKQGVLPDDEIIYAMMNCNVFISGCDDIEISTDFKIPILQQYQKYNYDERVTLLKQILEDNYNKEDSDHKTKDRYDGMLYELGEISASTTADYFLTNYNIVHLATSEKYKGHLTTTSRGSASSYYSSKLLGFTTMDRFESEVPIYPERFITKDRILSSHQCPDIDYNVEKQEPFLLASRELLGEHGCYPLLAVGTLGEKSGFKLYASIKNIDPDTANDITTSIDQYNEALKQADDEEDKKNIHIEDYITDKEHLKIFNDSKPYQGIIEQAKCHACGHLIFNGDVNNKDAVGYGDIRYEIGLIRCHSKSTGKTTIVACVEGGLLDLYGYVKNDYLIVDVVGIIYELYHSLGREVPTVNELRKMVENDEKTWNLYAMGATCCLNQCEKPGTTKRAMKYQPKNIKELAAFIAGIRPGFKSLLDGFLNRVEYTSGEKAIDDLLEDCFRYMLYQEAVMKIFSYLGIPMKDSYDTIKKISKKKLKGEALKHVEDTLKEHWASNIGNLDNFEPVYKVIKDSARYSFNAPHALAMANDSLYEAWVKGHFLSIFYEVTLNHYQDKNDKDKVSDLTKEAMLMFGYKMGQYEYGKDNSKFTVDDELKIIYPNLFSVKGIGKKAVDSMMDIYQKGLDDFVDIYLAIKGTNINATVFKSLTKIGYFKKFGTIKRLLTAIDTIDQWREKSKDEIKTIKKSEMPQLGLDGICISNYATDKLASGKTSQAQYKIFNWNGLVKEICSKIPNEEYELPRLIKFQYEVLGYIEYINEELNPRYIVITDLDTSYSPKFKAYCLKTGQVCEMKIHSRLVKKDKRIKTSFADTPFENGDVLYMTKCDKDARRRKGEDGWEIVSNEFVWWINDYRKIEVI